MHVGQSAPHQSILSSSAPSCFQCFPDTNSQHKRPSCSPGTWVDPSPFASLSPRSNFESLGPIWSNMVPRLSLTVNHWLEGPMSSHISHHSPVASMGFYGLLTSTWLPSQYRHAIRNGASIVENSTMIGISISSSRVNHGSFRHDMCDKAHVSPHEGCPIISKALVLAWHSRPNCKMLGFITMATGKEMMWEKLVFSAEILTIDYIRAPDFCQIWMSGETRLWTCLTTFNILLTSTCRILRTHLNTLLTSTLELYDLRPRHPHLQGPANASNGQASTQAQTQWSNDLRNTQDPPAFPACHGSAAWYLIGPSTVSSEMAETQRLGVV